jgi:UDP-N-acetylmuramoylalanine--D-glutamate ligase
MGLGLFGGGDASARFAAERGANVTVTDKRTEHDLAESIGALNSIDLRYVLGRHDEADYRNADIIIVSPAVPRDSPL